MSDVNYEGSRRVMDHEREFDKAHAKVRVRREESERNWAMYSGFDNGQWQKEAVNQLHSQNRHVAQYNFIRGKVDNLAGVLNKNELDVDYVPVDSETNEYTRLIKGLYYADKELMDWKRETLQADIDGLVHSSMMEMSISDKYNVLGNIALTRLTPGSYIEDPFWKSHNSYDMKSLWKVTYLTPEEIKTIYGKKSGRIDQMCARMAIQGMDYESSEESGSIPYYNLDQIYGSKYRVIEHHHIKETAKTIETVVGDNGKLVLAEGTPEELKEQIADELGNGRIIRHRKIVREYWVTTSCRQLDQEEFLEDRKGEIQIGRLPFFPWSAARINGRDSGFVDLLVDIQQAINKRESLSDHMISTAAHGAMAVDPAMFGNDIAKTKAFIENLSKPNAKAITAPGALASGRRYTQLIEKNQYNGELYQEIQRMGDYLDKISKSTATMEGRNESAHDTGRLFAMRQMQSEIALTTLTRSYEQHWNEIGEAYMLLAQQLYSGAYREFNTNFGDVKGEKTVIAVNYQDENQIPVTLKGMPRHKVVVSQSAGGLTVRATERAINSEVLQNIPPEMALSRAATTKNIMKTLDMSDEDKQRLEFSSDIEYQLTLERMQTEIESLRMQREQMALQTQQQQMATEQQAMGLEQMAMGEQEVPVEQQAQQ